MDRRTTEIAGSGRAIRAAFSFQQPFGRTAAGMSDLSPAVACWRDQIERLSEHASPSWYLLPPKWQAIRENALAFLDQFGAEAYRLGWTAPQLFGVHPEHGFLRVEYAGALMATDRPVVGVDDTRIVFDHFSGYRTKPGQQWGIPVWEFAAEGGQGRSFAHDHTGTVLGPLALHFSHRSLSLTSGTKLSGGKRSIGTSASCPHGHSALRAAPFRKPLAIVRHHLAALGIVGAARVALMPRDRISGAGREGAGELSRIAIRD